MNTKTDYKAAALERFKAGPMQSRAVRAEERAEDDFARILLEVESPIEAIFLCALFDESSLDDAAFREKGAHRFFGYSLERTEIAAQYGVDNFRCDFAIWHNHRNGTTTRIIVECDGHDFHERTKEQAQRDRSRDRILTAKGWRVLRFTGSELYRNAEACVAEIAQIIENDSQDDWRLANG